MLVSEEQAELLKKEIKYKTSRSGGKGGQNVNKVESRVELLFDISNSTVLTDIQKQKISGKLAGRINEEGILRVTEDKYRSQLQNKEEALKKLFGLFEKSLKPVKARKATKPSKSSKQKRIDSKKKRGDIKSLRKKLF